LRQKAKVRLETRGGDPVVSYFPLEELQFIKTGKQRRAEIAAEIKEREANGERPSPPQLKRSVGEQASTPAKPQGRSSRPAGEHRRAERKTDQPPASKSESEKREEGEAPKPRRRRRKRPGGGGGASDTPKAE